MLKWKFFIIFIVVITGCTASIPNQQPKWPVNASATPYAQRETQITLRGERLRIRYIDEGEGPIVKCIPGHSDRIEGCDKKVGALLKAGFRVLVMDYPGSGYSEKPDRRYDLEYQEDATIAFLDAIGVDPEIPVSLIGTSLAGNLALRLAHRFPKRFNKIVAASMGSSWEVNNALKALGFSMKLLIENPGLGEKLFWPVVKTQMRASGLSDKEREEAFVYFREVYCRGFTRAYWGLAYHQIIWSLRSIASEIEQPTLLFARGKDTALGVNEGVRAVHELMPNSQLIWVKDAGHMVIREAFEIAMPRILEFLKEK